MPKPQVFLDGQRFGRLLVVAFHSYNPTKWVCTCDCGRTKVVTTRCLHRGRTQSCGCLFKEIIEKGAHFIHGEAPHTGVSREYQSWQNAKRRCHDPTHRYFANYGGRGITMCERWRFDFRAFVADMGRCPANHSLDRVDNHRGYERDNCRWASRLEQMNNMRSNRTLTFNGATRTVAEWAARTGLRSGTIRARLDKQGWSAERALTTPVR